MDIILPEANTPLYPQSIGFKFLKTKVGHCGLLCDFLFDPTLYRVLVRHGSEDDDVFHADMESAAGYGGDIADCAAMTRATFC